MIGIGDKAPALPLRTDEGTPLSLEDLKGRATAVFLLGKAFSPTVERLFEVLTRNINRFMVLDLSPVAVLGETVEHLEQYRNHNDVPFLLMSDEKLKLHAAFEHAGDNSPMVWLVDKDGIILDMLPMLPPSELVAVVADRAARLITPSPKSDSDMD